MGGILVTGGAGVLGSRLVAGLVADGHRVRALTLPGDPLVTRLSGVDCEIVYGDIASAASLAGLFEGVETVFHLAAVIIAPNDEVLRRINVEGTRNVVRRAAEAGARHFVYCSSAAAINPRSSVYARTKQAAEEIVRGEGRMRWTIARPTLIYERGGGQEFLLFLESLMKYPVVPFVGRGRAKKNPVLADDVVRGLRAIAGNDRTYGRIYNLSGGEEIGIADLARLMLKHQGVRKPFVHIPLPLCRVAAFALERTMSRPPLTRYAISRIEEEAALDNSSARRDLGYDPVGVREGLARCFPLR